MYVLVGSQWQKNTTSIGQYNYYVAFSATTFQAYTNLPFEMYTYDADEKCYVATQTGNGMSGTFKVFFENKKIVKFLTTVVNSNVGETINTQIDITYNAPITLPDENVGGGTGGGESWNANTYNDLVTFASKNCVMTCLMSSPMGSQKSVWTLNNGNAHVEYFVGNTFVYEEYFGYVDGVYYSYEKDEDTGAWGRVDIGLDGYNLYVGTCNINTFFAFEDWTYDSASGKYVCASKTYGEGDHTVTYTNAWFIIEDGKITTLGMTVDGNIQYSYNVEYVDVAITFPVVE